MKRAAIAVIGSGRAARAIVANAERAGFTSIRVAARSGARARAAAASRLSPDAPARPGIRAVRSLSEAVRGAAFVVVAVSDRSVAEVARRLAAEAPRGWAARTVLHLSGALGPDPLEPLARLGAAAGALHFLTVFGPRPRGLAGATFRVDGDPAFRRRARAFASALGIPARDELRARGRWTDRERARYHAAAALVANDLGALLEEAVRVLRSTGMTRRVAERALAGLAGDAARVFGSEGPRGGLTGPVVRGDVDTLRRHLDALRSIEPGAAEAHRLLSLRLVRMALDARRIPSARAAAMRRLLAGPSGGRGV